MKWLHKNFTSLIQLFVILLISCFCRFLFLDRVPSGISNDELDYVLNAKAVWLSGKDIGQQWNPLSLTSPTSTFPMAELPTVILSPFIGPFSLSLLHARWGYALFGVLLTCILYFLTKELFHSRLIGFAVGLVAAISPWGIFFSRTSLESPIAIVFYYLFFYLAIQKNKTAQWLSLIPFVIAFFSYIGTKLIVIPVAILIVVYLSIHKKKQRIFSLTLLGISILLTLFFVYASFSNPSRSRMNELFLPHRVSQTVDTERKNTIPTPLLSIMSNKGNSYLTVALSKYLNAFSPNLLFLTGDDRSAFSVWDHGYLYILDIIFLVLGFSFMFTLHKKQLLFLTCLILISPIPSVASTVGISYPLRSALLFPTLVCIIGYGIAHCIQSMHSKTTKTVFLVIILCAYSFFTIRFLHIYLYRNPIANSEGFDFSSRIVSSYLKRSTQKTVVVTGSPQTPYKHYLFDSNEYTKDNIQKVASDIRNNTYSFGIVTFENCLNVDLLEPNATYVVQPSKDCDRLFEKLDRLQITQLSDAGSVYFIYNDVLCQNVPLNAYVRVPTLDSLNVENLSDEAFCKIFITRNN